MCVLDLYNRNKILAEFNKKKCVSFSLKYMYLLHLKIENLSVGSPEIKCLEQLFKKKVWR